MEEEIKQEKTTKRTTGKGGWESPKHPPDPELTFYSSESLLDTLTKT
jgi:hypothetical protein